MEDNSEKKSWRVRLLVCVTAASLMAVGCGKSKVDPAEQKALERHHQEVLLRRALRGEIEGPDGARLFKALRFLSVLDHNNQFPGPSEGDQPRLTSVRGEVTPNGPYFFTQEFQIAVRNSHRYGYVLAETYSNGDFQLEKAWHADAAGKLVKEYPMKPPPPMSSPRAAFLGPNNPGAERGLNGWFYGTLGGGLVSRDAIDPATGFNCFKVGITNDISGQTNHADLRSEIFLLGPAAYGRQPITFSFAYKFQGKIKPGDRLQVLFRYYDRDTNFLDQETIDLGTNHSDSQMTQYKTLTLSGLIAPAKAAASDIVVAANINDAWTSGAAQFDDFLVLAIPPRARTGLIIAISFAAALTPLVIWALVKLGGARREKISP
ncbi:MAG TPA: hypothetical protein VFC44_19490 [Candidatus Saccharimonadales bacterium]|nr:hypothetical protein [Candidatus Saccharimonadales bacterium]